MSFNIIQTGTMNRHDGFGVRKLTSQVSVEGRSKPAKLIATERGDPCYSE